MKNSVYRFSKGFVYKACRSSIVTLRKGLKNNEKRQGVMNPRYANFRCEKAVVVGLEDVETGERIISDRSIYDENFNYDEGVVVSTDFDEDINKVCAPGIHYFMDREAAISHYYQRRFHDYAVTCPSGIHNEWYEDGRLRRQIHYKDHKYHGKFSRWQQNGKKIEECEYVDDKRNGLRTLWWDNGKKSSMCEYVDDLRHGACISWYESGKEEMRCEYRCGKLNGLLIKWDEEGNELCRRVYFQGWKL